MESELYSEEQEKRSTHSSNVNVEKNKLPKIKEKRDKKRKLKTVYLTKSRNSYSITKNDLNNKRITLSSPKNNKTKNYFNNKQFKFNSPKFSGRKFNEKFYPNYNSQNTYYKTGSDNDSLSKNSSSIKFFNIPNFSNYNNINGISLNNNIDLSKINGNYILNKNHKRATKRKITLKLTKKNLNINPTMTDYSKKKEEEKYFNFQSDSSNMISSDEIYENQINSPSKIKLSNLNSETEENNDEEEYDKISVNSNKIKNGQNFYLLPSHNSMRNITNNLNSNILSLKKNVIFKEPIKNKNPVKFQDIKEPIKENKKKEFKIFRRMTTLHRSNTKNKTEKKEKEIIILSDIFDDDYPTIIRRVKRESSIIKRPFIINVNKYLDKEREKIKNSCLIPFDVEYKFKEKKNNFIDNITKEIKNNINVENKKINDENNEKENMNKLIKSAFTNFYQKIIIKNMIKELENSIFKTVFTYDKITILPNLHYISNHFFDCFSFVNYYLLDGQYKEKEFNNRKVSIIDNNLKILNMVTNIFPKLLNSKKNFIKFDFVNKHFLNLFYVNDFIVPKNKDFLNDDKTKYFDLIKSRKITRKRKRISIHDLIHKKIPERKKILNEDLNRVNNTKEELEYKTILNKFHETNKILDKFNPLKKESILNIRLKTNNEEEEKLRKEFQRRKRKYLLNIRWKKDIEILKSLGGDPVSKYCSLIKTQEIEEENSNTKTFEKLLVLIDKSQNELFFEEYRNLRFLDINHQEKYTGDTLLIRASKINNIYIIIFLLEKGCNINIQNHELNTALHYAYMYNRAELINLLISHGADENILNKKGYTPWECMKNFE